MKKTISAVIFLGAISLCFVNLKPILAQQCDDDESMVKDYEKDLTGLVETTRKESLTEFERAFHQKACLTKLGFCINMLDELLGCLQKSAADPTTTKDQQDAIKSKIDALTKLKDKLESDRKALKGTDDAKTAKTLIEKFQFIS